MNHRGVHFNISKEWVEAAFEQAASANHNNTSVPFYEGCIGVSWIVALLQHDSTRSFEDFLANKRSIESNFLPGRGYSVVKRISQSSTLGECAKELGNIAGGKLSMRVNGVAIRSISQLSNGFLPPPSSQVAAACMQLFAARRRNADLLGSRYVRLVSYIILLTIHPFRDRNGRSARLFFAADAIFQGGDFFDLLALVFFHGSGGANFHLAAKCARLGDFTMLFSSFDAMRQQAQLQLGADVEHLNRCLREGADQDALAAALQLYKCARFQLRESL